MCSPNAVVDVPNREVNRVIDVLTSSDGDGRLVAAEDDGNEHGAVSCGVHRDSILLLNIRACWGDADISLHIVPRPNPHS